jgi:hypothetical protein
MLPNEPEARWQKFDRINMERRQTYFDLATSQGDRWLVDLQDSFSFQKHTVGVCKVVCVRG